MEKLRFSDRQNTYKSKRQKISLYVGAVVLGIGTLAAFLTMFDIKVTGAGSIAGGMAKTWNEAADVLGKSHYILLEHYKAGNANGVFIALLAVIAIVTARLVVSTGPVWPAVIYVLPICIWAVAFDLYPAFWTVCLMAAGYILARVSQGEVFDLRACAAVLIVCTAVIAIACIPAVKTGLSEPEAIESLQAKSEAAFENLRYTEEPQITVTMDEPESMYLRGFIGESYEDGEWTALDTAEHYENRNLCYRLSEQGFAGPAQLTQSAEIADEQDQSEETERNAVTIEVSGKTGKYAFIPYEITSEIKGTKNRSDSFLTFGSDPNVCAQSTEKDGKEEGSESSGSVADVDIRIDAGDAASSEKATAKKYSYTVSDNKTGRWTDIAGKLFEIEPSAKLEKYSKLEAFYNSMVYEEYTDIDRSTEKRLASKIGSAGDQSKGHIGYKVAIERICGFLEKQTDDKKCASEASLMFRYYGIPARYAEGYLVTLEDEKQMKAETPYELSKDRYHAWTEIYVDGVGWVPVETCSSCKGLMAEADMDAGLRDAESTWEFDETASQAGGKSAESEQDKQSDISAWQYILIGLAMLAGAALTAVIVLFLVRAVRKKAQEKRLWESFEQKDIRKAICAMYGYMQREKIPCGKAACEVAMRGAYSIEPVTEQDRAVLSGVLKERAKGSSKSKAKRKR